MSTRVGFLFLGVLVLMFSGSTMPARCQSSPGGADTILKPGEAAKILPGPVFFRGQSAPVQGRNSGGVKFGDGLYVLAALVDTSGYSSSVQEKYQAYLITEAAIEIGGHALPPGAYGVGFVSGQFGVMDLGNHLLFSVASTHDDGLKRPTPLQIAADGASGKYRLYEGREYVAITRSAP